MFPPFYRPLIPPKKKKKKKKNKKSVKVILPTGGEIRLTKEEYIAYQNSLNQLQNPNVAENDPNAKNKKKNDTK